MTRQGGTREGYWPPGRASHMGRPRPAVKRALAILWWVGAIALLGGCAYYEQVVGNAETYYDAKVETWFKAACTLNLGALGRIGEHRREVVVAACPPRTEPAVVPAPKMVERAGG